MIAHIQFNNYIIVIFLYFILILFCLKYTCKYTHDIQLCTPLNSVNIYYISDFSLTEKNFSFHQYSFLFIC